MINLQKVRVERRLSRSRLSQMAGVNLTTLYEFESGRRKPYPKAVNAIAEALAWESDPAELFTEVMADERD